MFGSSGSLVPGCQHMEPGNDGLIHDLFHVWLGYLVKGKGHYSPLTATLPDASVPFTSQPLLNWHTECDLS